MRGTTHLSKAVCLVGSRSRRAADTGEVMVATPTMAHIHRHLSHAMSAQLRSPYGNSGQSVVYLISIGSPGERPNFERFIAASFQRVSRPSYTNSEAFRTLKKYPALGALSPHIPPWDTSPRGFLGTRRSAGFLFFKFLIRSTLSRPIVSSDLVVSGPCVLDFFFGLAGKAHVVVLHVVGCCKLARVVINCSWQKAGP